MLETIVLAQISVLTGFRVLIPQHHILAYHSQDCSSRRTFACIPPIASSLPPKIFTPYKKSNRESTVYYADIITDKQLPGRPSICSPPLGEQNMCRGDGRPILLISGTAEKVLWDSNDSSDLLVSPNVLLRFNGELICRVTSVGHLQIASVDFIFTQNIGLSVTIEKNPPLYSRKPQISESDRTVFDFVLPIPGKIHYVSVAFLMLLFPCISGKAEPSSSFAIKPMSRLRASSCQ